MTEVSVIVCTRNGAARVRAHLGSVAASVNASARDAELIVVDNGSTDDTPNLSVKSHPGPVSWRHRFPD